MSKVIVILIVCFIAPCAAFAQSTYDAWENLDRVRPDRRIEVVDMKLRAVKGGFVSASADAILLNADGRQVSIPRADVFSVKDREGASRGRRTLLGLGLGAAAGVAVGAIAGARYYEKGETGVFMLVWTPIGAGIGAGAGAALPVGDKTIYRVRSRQVTSGVLAK